MSGSPAPAQNNLGEREMPDFNAALIPPSLKALPIWLLHRPGLMRTPPSTSNACTTPICSSAAL
jgi:hypothetical protein